jgi:MFS family permease
MILSALLFGAAMFTTPTAVTDLVKSSLPKTAWGPAVAVFTVVFAIGQAIGPVLSGWLADVTHSLDAGLAGSVVILLAASAVAMSQRQDKAERAALSQPPTSTPMTRTQQSSRPAPGTEAAIT